MADDRTDRMRLRVSRTLFVRHLMSHQASGGMCSDGEKTKVVVTSIGYENDHTAHGSVEVIEGTPIPEAKVEIDEETGELTVTIDNVRKLGLNGQWVRVTYGVILDNSVVGDETQYEQNRHAVENNKTVISEDYPSHTGIETTASYEVYVEDTKGGLYVPDDYRIGANGITVTPPAPDIKVEKVWRDGDGGEIAWPQGAEVTIELLGNGKSIDVVSAEVMGKDNALPAQTATLTAGQTSCTFKGVPRYANIEYTVKEKATAGVPKGFTSEVTGSADKGFTVTNTVETTKGSTSDDTEKPTSDPTSQTTTSSTPLTIPAFPYRTTPIPYGWNPPYWPTSTHTTATTTSGGTSTTSVAPYTPYTPGTTPYTNVSTSSAGAPAQSASTAAAPTQVQAATGGTAQTTVGARSQATPTTADPTNVAAIVLPAISGFALVGFGRRRRR